MDWDDARIFLGIYRAGTLRGAAARLGIDQATAGRRLAALETALHAKLFLRTPGGYVPTPAGEAAARSAEKMEQAAHQLEREMQGIDHRLSGVVRLATTDTMAQHFVLDALRLLHERHPDIRVVLHTTTTVSNLTRREADLAVRTLKPTDPDLVSRHLANRASGLYASTAYLQRCGMPDGGLAGHDLLIYHASVAPRQASHVAGMPVAGARVALEVNTGLMLLEAARLGIGIAELPIHMAEQDPRLVRIFPGKEHRYDMYLVMHGDLARSARVRAVADAIVESVP
ncbi:DNA-binding transcriptional LysR family regulator [Pseudoduganella flava]|uniref:DNA-binding transcriptional LysR family regulator n=1 Tax=Pseudoduganella flava TaxID=871742 RepID=A0A562PZ40_9BURK|nr:LysR family transcriptional regulator [Pseudoduganella flava]QGZ38763.1 LysR family transcriptional regulator [Pseudoduganella flava]TWI49658.1 DNA-binding transcriptional LysR family regulator [Pseudoduganella flava]